MLSQPDVHPKGPNPRHGHVIGRAGRFAPTCADGRRAPAVSPSVARQCSWSSSSTPHMAGSVASVGSDGSSSDAPASKSYTPLSL